MTFIHEDSEFEDLLRIVAERRRLSLGLVEKDYRVTHALWALHAQGLDVWFKGGTSLSKGFGIIERFSEDLDLEIDPGRFEGLPLVSNWKSEGAKATKERRDFFDRLASLLVVPHTTVALDAVDEAWRRANVRVTYPGKHLGDLGGILRPFVLLEIGSARVTPSVARDMTSFVHTHLAELNQLAGFDPNLPTGVRCVHLLVTLLEKLDAIHRRVPDAKAEPATFVRHFEDAARIIAAGTALPLLTEYDDLRALAAEMVTQKQLASLPNSDRWRVTRASVDEQAHGYAGPAPSRVSSRLAFLEAHRRLAALL